MSKPRRHGKGLGNVCKEGRGELNGVSVMRTSHRNRPDKKREEDKQCGGQKWACHEICSGGSLEFTEKD